MCKQKIISEADYGNLMVLAGMLHQYNWFDELGCFEYLEYGVYKKGTRRILVSSEQNRMSFQKMALLNIDSFTIKVGLEHIINELFGSIGHMISIPNCEEELLKRFKEQDYRIALD